MQGLCKENISISLKILCSMALYNEVPKFSKCPKCGKPAKIKFVPKEISDKTVISVKIYECEYCGYKGERF